MNFPKTVRGFRNFLSAVLVCFGFSGVRAWDTSKPFIYEMKIAFETDNWTNHYSTTTILSKSDNSVAFRVVSNSTTTPTYQLIVTTQGNVGVGTAAPAQKLSVAGAIESTTGGFKFPDGSTQTAAVVLPASLQDGDLLYYSNGAWTRLAAGSAGQSLKLAWDGYAKLLLQLDNNAADSACSKPVSNSGVTFSGGVYKFGGYSGAFNGSSYLSLSDSDDWNFGTGDFTIDFWIRFNSLAQNNGILYQNTDANNFFTITMQSDGTLYFWVRVSGTNIAYKTYAPAVSTGQWYHWAFVRSGENLYFFQNGTQVGAAYAFTGDQTMPDISGAFNVGYANQVSGENYLNGWLDEFRISKGVARWTSDFSPPSYAYSPSLTWGN